MKKIKLSGNINTCRDGKTKVKLKLLSLVGAADIILKELLKKLKYNLLIDIRNICFVYF